MKFFNYETSKKQLNLYPFVCWHLGAPQCNLDFIEKMIDIVKEDDNAMWLYLGDGGECATKHSKGDVYNQPLNPTQQQNAIRDLLEPVKHKGLFGVKGNHGNRVYKETGLDFDETLCAKLGIPYLGTAAFWRLTLASGSDNPVNFSIYTHHGSDSGISIGSKVVKGQAFDRTFIADSIITAHSHIAIDLPPRYYATLANSRRESDPIVWKETREYIAGSAYDSRTGYAEEKGYPPLLPSHIAIHYSIGRDDKDRRVGRQSSTLYRPDSF